MSEDLQTIRLQSAQELKQIARRLDAISEELPFEISVRRNLIARMSQAKEDCNTISSILTENKVDTNPNSENI